MLCVKTTLHFHKRQVVDGDIPEPQLASVVQEGPRERIGIQWVRNNPPLPVHTLQASALCFQLDLPNQKE